VYVVAHTRTNAFVAPTNSSDFHLFVPLSVAVQRSGSNSGKVGSSSVGVSVGVPVAEAVVAVAGVASTTEVETVGQTSGKSNVVEGSVGLV